MTRSDLCLLLTVILWIVGLGSFTALSGVCPLLGVPLAVIWATYVGPTVSLLIVEKTVGS